MSSERSKSHVKSKSLRTEYIAIRPYVPTYRACPYDCTYRSSKFRQYGACDPCFHDPYYYGSCYYGSCYCDSCGSYGSCLYETCAHCVTCEHDLPNCSLSYYDRCDSDTSETVRGFLVLATFCESHYCIIANPVQ